MGYGTEDSKVQRREPRRHWQTWVGLRWKPVPTTVTTCTQAEEGNRAHFQSQQQTCQGQGQRPSRIQCGIMILKGGKQPCRGTESSSHSGVRFLSLEVVQVRPSTLTRFQPQGGRPGKVNSHIPSRPLTPKSGPSD